MNVEVEGDDGRWSFVPSLEDSYEGRNYRLFSVLAGVRNEGKRIEPISEPRGLPSDVSPELAELASGLDWHSHSYYGLAELLAFDWDKKTKAGGFVGLETYEEWKGSTEIWPRCWSGGVGGPGVVRVTEAEYLAERAIQDTRYKRIVTGKH